MDHHCPWTSKCIGYYSLKPFMLFLFYLSLLTTEGLCVVGYNALYNEDKRFLIGWWLLDFV